jgi:hypothetical protein
MRLGKPGPEPQRRFTMIYGCLILAFPFQRNCQIIVRVSVVGPEPQ